MLTPSDIPQLVQYQTDLKAFVESELNFQISKYPEKSIDNNFRALNAASISVQQAINSLGLIIKNLNETQI